MTNLPPSLVWQMKNILVPTDFSQNSKNALKYAQVLFGSLECNFYLLYVGTLLDVETDTRALVDISDEPIENTKQKLQDLLDDSRKHSANKDHFFYALHEYGFFVPTIKKHLEDKHIDLIVMGTKGTSGLREKVVGSNAGDVITKIKCNTLVVPNGVEFVKPTEIAFPTDLNIFYSYWVLKSMAEILYLGKGNFRIMNAKKEGIETSPEQERNKEFLLDFMEETFSGRYSFHSLTNKSAKSAIQCFVESRNIDMMVMVAKNLNFIQQILFDPMVEKIGFHTKIPFYIVHE